MKFIFKSAALLSFIFFTLSLSAQKVKLSSGSPDGLATQKSYNIEYTFDNLKIQKLSEEDYINKNKSEKEKDEVGSGEVWATKWNENLRGGRFFDQFEELFNKTLTDNNVMAGRDNQDTNCTIVVNTHYIDPGFNVGFTRKPAYISMTATFMVDDKAVASISMEKAPGMDVAGFDFDVAYRLSEGYAKSGKSLAKYLIKQVYEKN